MDDEYKSLVSVAGTVSRETYQVIKGIEADLRHWNERINLISSSTVSHLWSRHILDSGQLLNLAPDANRWLDLGSGAGLPGLIVAALLRTKTDAMVHLVESNRKKCAFMQSVIGTYGLPAHVHAVRIEDLVPVEVDAVSARAFAPLSTLLDLSAVWLERGATAFFHKGRDYAAEVDEAVRKWSFELVEHRSAVDQSGMILEISKLRRRR